MTTSAFNEHYWESRYLDNNIPWDMGGPSPALTEYLKSISPKTKILIPGAGPAWEAQWLEENGFENIHVIDISEKAVSDAKERIGPNSSINWWHGNFFEHAESYDLVVEQTFFCALDPEMRNAYAEHMHKILKPGGRLMGLLFNFPLSADGPPFGGSIPEYQALFEKHFEIKHLEECYNSIKPRAGREIFIELIA